MRWHWICAALAVLSLAAACGGGGSGGALDRSALVNGPNNGGGNEPNNGGGNEPNNGGGNEPNNGGGNEPPSGPLFNQWGLRTVGADRAYTELRRVRGAGANPGAGQTVGFIDSGIDQDHPVFAGKKISETFLGGATDENGSRRSHGTAVASVVAALPTDTWAEELDAARGVAWGADVAMFAIRTGSGRPPYSPITLFGLRQVDDRLATWFRTVIDWTDGGRSLDFVNLSWGFDGLIDTYTERQLRDNLGATIPTLAQAGSADKVVFVIAAGNDQGRQCNPADFTANPDLCPANLTGTSRLNARSAGIIAALMARIPELRSHTLAVVAVGQDGRIAPFSNRCGLAAPWCLAAPGVQVRAAYFGPHPDDGSDGARGVFSASGTSFAAPMVTGGLAVMKHYFRDTMLNTELVARLLATADRRGDYADSAVYGQGLMDLGAAVQPVGLTGIALGGRVGGPSVDMRGTRLAAGGALGNALTAALAGGEIVAFDALGAPFWFALDGLAGDAPDPPLTARLRSFMAPVRPGAVAAPLRPAPVALTRAAGPAGWRLGMTGTTPTGAGGGHLSLAGRAVTLGAAGRGGFGFSAFSSEGLPGQAPVSGAALSWRPAASPLALVGGAVAERETMLGSTASGAFGRISGASTFAGIEGSAAVGAWRMGIGAELGTVSAAPRGGMISSVSPLATSAFALRAERRLGRGALTVSAGQPLRVETGRAKLSIPVSRTKGGLVVRRSLTADLEPGGRQIDIAAQWRRPAGGGEMRLGAVWSRQPGHDAAADPDLSILAGWRRRF